MDFNPDDARQYIEDAEYPANKGALISAAERNDAPQELVDRLGTLSTPDFPDPDAVVRELRSSPTSG